MYNCSNFAFASNFAGRGEAGDNFFVFYNNGNLSHACAEEQMKQRAETRFRSNMVPIWWQHIQRSGGYLMCSYARSNGVYDLATKIGCPTCPCGHGNIDKYLDKKCHKHLDPALFTNHSKINNPVHSKKDRADIAHPTAKNVNFVMVEYNTFRKCAPVPGKFVYVTLLRDPVDQLISCNTADSCKNYRRQSQKSPHTVALAFITLHRPKNRPKPA